MWRFCVNPVAETPHAFFIIESGEIWQNEKQVYKQIVEQKCVSPGFVGLRISFFERKGEFMDTGKQFLGTERIEKLMRQYAIPCIISLLVGAVINIILDPIFIFCFR